MDEMEKLHPSQKRCSHVTHCTWRPFCVDEMEKLHPSQKRCSHATHHTWRPFCVDEMEQLHPSQKRCSPPHTVPEGLSAWTRWSRRWRRRSVRGPPRSSQRSPSHRAGNQILTDQQKPVTNVNTLASHGGKNMFKRKQNDSICVQHNTHNT